MRLKLGRVGIDEVIDACVKVNIVSQAAESNQAGSTPDWPGLLASVEILADLVLDSAAAGQLVAVTDGDYDGGFEEKGIPSLRREKKKTHTHIHNVFKTTRADKSNVSN